MGPELIKNIVEELDASLSGGVVSKVHQPDEKTLVLKVFARGEEKRLVISVHHAHGRAHLTSRRFVNPPAPLRFCAFLRSRLTDARVAGVAQKGGERIVLLRLEKKADGGVEPFVLRAELTGKSGNVILLDSSGVVLDAMRYFPAPAQRVVEPGVALAELPPKKAAPEELLEKSPKESWNEAVDMLYAGLLEEDAFTVERRRLKRAVNEALKKSLRKLENLKADEVNAIASLGLTGLGDLIVRNLSKIKRGADEVTLDDYTKAPPAKVAVPLDPALSPRDNAERYFKKAKKGRTALGLLKGRIPKTEEEIEYLKAVSFDMDEAGTETELLGIAEELVKEGFLKMTGTDAVEKAGRMKGEAAKAEPVRRYVSSEGFEVLCGKSGAGNDLIVQRLASGEDIWFHAANVPGSHVLIKVAGRGKELTRATIEEAAALAAWHSKARGSMKVEVTYAEARNVKKPRGAKPGLVTVRERKSIMVKPRDMEQA